MKHYCSFIFGIERDRSLLTQNLPFWTLNISTWVFLRTEDSERTFDYPSLPYLPEGVQVEEPIRKGASHYLPARALSGRQERWQKVCQLD